MDSYTVSFWKDPVSKDDSAVELHDLHEAGLVHATVDRTDHFEGARYAVDLQDPELKAKYGKIVLARTPENRWQVLNALNSIEDIFMQLTTAIDDSENSPPEDI